MKANHLTLGAAIAIIGGGAFVAGRLSAPDAGSAAAGSQPATRSARASTATAGAAADDPSRGERSRPGVRARTADDADDAERTARMREALGHADPVDRTRAWLDFLDRLSDEDFLAVITEFRANGVPEDRMNEYAMLLAAWARRDPLGALDYAAANTGSPFARQTILASWAGYDPDAALRWAEANHQGEGANPWLIGVIRGIAASDPVRATGLLTSMPFSPERGEALAAVLPAILSQGPDAARAWVSAIEDQRLRDGAMTQVADRLAAIDPKGTADWLVSASGEAANRRIDDVLSAWMRTDQAAAIGYFGDLPAGPARTNALRGIVNSIALEDPRRAAAFLDSHATDVNDNVVQQFVWHAFREEPSIAADYIGRIANQGERENMYRRTLGSWLERDQAAAMTWLSANTVPESVVRHLEHRVREQQRRQQ